MKILKFLAKCILALLPILAVVIYTALVPFGYMDSEYPAWKYTHDVSYNKLESQAISIIGGLDGPTAVFVAGNSGDNKNKTLILGDSRAMADLIPSGFNSSATNLAVGGATSIEMYYTLNTYIENNGVPDNVIIMIAPFHYSIIDNFWTRTAYFNYLSISDMNELYSYAKACNSETLLKKGYKNDLLSYRMRFPDKYLPALINSKLIGRYNSNSSEYYKILENSGYGEFGTLDGCSDLNYETGYEEMHDTKDAVLLDIYLNRLLTLCEENSINTVLTVPPMNRSSYDNLKPSYLDDLKNYFDTITILHPGVTVEADIPVYDDVYFGDASHLNHKGAMKFTDEFTASHNY